MNNMAIIIGSCTDITYRQVNYIRNNLISPVNSSTGHFNIQLFDLTGNNFAVITKKDFILSLKEYSVLVLSGGETAYTVLDNADFGYLESGPHILPLISTGIIYGGILDGKKYIIKGGSIGDESIYKKIIEYADINMR
ncbi:MAG: hypothetical protein AMDU4_FER2C00056G0002 [Ferroplasma sp. Type II]|jgi:uncharacterized protein YgbK (DUF1537 family)|uniref:nucleotide-binding domain containing protein n=1 Tax=Ferroplasma sp. Type II TaxID=261388 RepID=UPI000389609E|nr:nucleotide-binding domain containing protein [Ferroplasma sp. Type II]EQB73598.1 MAG: hypothetical protein AMDU4_FER2C00056G0002 [Ferroplasma sp. Type II]